MITTFLLAALTSTATAGTLVVETTVAAEVRLGELKVAHTYGPGEVRVPDIEAGEHDFIVFRGGYAASVRIDVPDTGEVHLRISADGITGDLRDEPEPVEEGPPPKVEFRAVTGTGYTVILDGEPGGSFTVDEALVLDSLGPGNHSIEIRSLDKTTIWAKATLELRLGDNLVLHVREGRMPEVFGRAEAWKVNK